MQQLNLETLAGIRHALEDSRREGLTSFINQFMVLLVAEGYKFEDLLHALANWADEQSGLDEVVKHLESAINEVRQKAVKAPDLLN